MRFNDSINQTKNNRMKLLLLGTAGCHLCEMAETLINSLLLHGAKIHIEHIDIAEHTEWQQDYATLIPVLMQKETLSTLNWPFTRENVLTFIEQNHD
jgi:hypothetical protein